MEETLTLIRDFRKKVKDLQALKGYLSTNQLIRETDSLFRTMVYLKEHLQRRLNYVDDDSFYGLFYALKPIKEGDYLCPKCICEILKSDRVCDYCGAEFDTDGTQAVKDDTYRIGEFESAEEQGKYNLVTLKKYQEHHISEIKPITKKDLIPGPTGKQSGKPQSKKKVLSPAARDMVTWARSSFFCSQFPFSEEVLQKFAIEDLRTLVRTVPGFTIEKTRRLNKSGMILWILRNQPQEPIAPQPAPFGNVPTNMEDIYGKN